jgi:hypothetical protein
LASLTELLLIIGKSIKIFRLFGVICDDKDQSGDFGVGDQKQDTDSECAFPRTSQQKTIYDTVVFLNALFKFSEGEGR